MIRVLKSFGDIEHYRLPFLAYVPMSHESYDISVRIHDQKWPSLRYHVTLSGKAVRIKQFFLDSFFPGFPKSMLKDFSSGYSTIRSREVGGYLLFLGKNYRNHDAASFWVHGTMIEMDSVDTVSDDEYEKLAIDLLSSNPDPSRLEKFQFPDRSYHSKGFPGNWYEDQRITRLSWRRTGQFQLPIADGSLIASGVGFIQTDGGSHEIFIFQAEGYSRAVWVEIATKGIEIAHAFYDVRKGTGLFDTELELSDGKGLLIFRKPSGPAVIKINIGSIIMTAGFSPGLDLHDISSFLSKLDEILTLLERIMDSIPHRDAKS